MNIFKSLQKRTIVLQNKITNITLFDHFMQYNRSPRCTIKAKLFQSNHIKLLSRFPELNTSF